MNVKLVSKTLPIIEDKELSSEEFCVYIARVSNPSNQLNTETYPKLLNYLMKHRHWSPLQFADFCFEIKTSRAIAAQLLRHASADFQEASQRYSASTNYEEIELRKQGKTNRQVGDEPFDPLILDPVEEIKENASDVILEHIKNSYKIYESLLEEGVAKECARMVLPLCSSTTIYMKNNLRNWLAYLNVRLEEGTQKEHRQIALEIAKNLKKECPIVAEASNDFGDMKGNFL